MPNETYTITLDAHDLDLVRHALHNMAAKYESAITEPAASNADKDRYRARMNEARELCAELPLTRAVRIARAFERRAELGRALAEIADTVRTQDYHRASARLDNALDVVLAEIRSE